MRTDHPEVDGSPYVEDIRTAISRRWWTTTATSVQKMAAFEISRAGGVSELQLERSSGNPEVDRAALKAVTEASTSPLPASFAAPFLRFHVAFPPQRFRSTVGDAMDDSFRQEALSNLVGVGVPRNEMRAIAAYTRGAAESGSSRSNLPNRRCWREGRPGLTRSRGIGFTPPLWEPALVDEILPVRTNDAKGMARRLAREEALFSGASSGANVVAAIEVARRLGPDARVVTLMADSGLKYVNTDVYRKTG